MTDGEGFAFFMWCRLKRPDYTWNGPISCAIALWEWENGYR